MPLAVSLKGIDAGLNMLERVSATAPNLVDSAFDTASPLRIESGEIVTVTNVPLGELPPNFLDGLNVQGH